MGKKDWIKRKEAATKQAAEEESKAQAEKQKTEGIASQHLIKNNK